MNDVLLEGGKDSGNSWSDSTNTLQTDMTARVLHVASEGEILGFVGGSQRATYFDNTPLIDDFGNVNFGGKVVTWANFGTDVQDVLTQFKDSINTISVDAKVTTTAPVTKTTTNGDVNAVKVGISLPDGLYKQDSDGLKPTDLVMRIDKKLSAESAWITDRKIPYINQKSTSAYKETFTVDRPSNWVSGTWDVRLVRETADNTDVKIKNDLYFGLYSEVKHSNLAYPGSALIGIYADAKTVGQIPAQSFLVDGILCQVPNVYIPGRYNTVVIQDKLLAGDSDANYKQNGNILLTTTPTGDTASGLMWSEVSQLWVAGTYSTKTGSWVQPVYSSYIWDGSTFTTRWTNNPVWILYTLMTNTRYGLGDRIKPSMIDTTSFFAAARYCDELVTFNYNGVSKQRPRFTMNWQFRNRELAYKFLDSIAETFLCKIVIVDGLITLVQDRPSTVQHIFNNSDVVDGAFSYSGTALSDIKTAINITWYDPDNNYLASDLLVQCTSTDITNLGFDPQAKYGYNQLDITYIGCTSQNQAKRYARHKLYELMKPKEFCTFRTGLKGLMLMQGQVIQVMDSVVSGTTQGGRVLTGSSTTVVKLSNPVTLSAGSTITLYDASGGIVTANISQVAGTVSQVTLTAALSFTPAEGTVYNITTTVLPRLFKIINVKPDGDSSDMTYIVEAEEYTTSKYQFADESTALTYIKPINYTAVRGGSIGRPENLTLTPSTIKTDGDVNRKLIVSWTPPSVGSAVTYTITCNAAGSSSTSTTEQCSIELTKLPLGKVEISVFASSGTGNSSQPVSSNVTFTTPAVDSSGGTLLAPTSLQVKGGGTSFASNDVIFTWVNPIDNDYAPIKLKDFKVVIYNTSGVVVRTDYVDPVPGGQMAQYTYTQTNNAIDNGGSPARSFDIEVYCRDCANYLSASS